ncbi:MAG: alcohol dehydrogenase catalytic domain-containing protein [Thioalkalivibrionaceae bacterium]
MSGPELGIGYEPDDGALRDVGSSGGIVDGVTGADMQAVVLASPGPAEALRLEKVAMPGIAAPDQVLVRVVAAGLNPIDTKLRASMGYYPDRLPAILGCDGAGEVVAVGTAVTRVRPGDRVAWFFGGLGREAGSYAQFQVIPEGLIARVPEGVDMASAAALPLAWITQEEALIDLACVSAGETLLVLGGAGGVGHLAIQRAALRGVRVLATARSAESAALIEALGGEALRVAEPAAGRDGESAASSDASGAVLERLREDLRDATHGRGPEVVLDCVGPSALCPVLPEVALYGRVVSLLQSFCGCDAAVYQTARLRNLTLSHCLMLTPSLLDLQERLVRQRERVEGGLELLASGTVRVHVNVAPMAEVVREHRALEAGHTRGKRVLQIWPGRDPSLCKLAVGSGDWQ